jgi:hypothetical protein
MADVSLRVGSYTIPKKGPEGTKVFSFWWPAPAPDKAYFDVSISPMVDGLNAIKPLIEVKRERIFFYDNSNSLINKTLFLTLQNDNDFDVTFLAAHVLIN